MYSTLERTLRIDSEFYQKESFKVLDLIKKYPNAELTEFVNVSDGNHMSISSKFIDTGIPYYRGQDVKSFFIENSKPVCIDNESFNTPYMKRSHLKKGDVLLSIVGTIGSLSLVRSETEATCSCKLAILRPKKNIKAEVIATFLRSKYGQNQIKKFTRGAVQMGLILEDMNQLIVPNFEHTLQENIERLVISAYDKEYQAKDIYQLAEKLLFSELGIENLSVQSKNISVKKLSDSFLQTGRIDAEYYQPKYDVLFTMLKKTNTKKLGGKDGIVAIKKSIEPGSNAYFKEGIPFIRVSDIDKYGISDPEIKLSKNVVENVEKLYPTKDTILLSKDGSVGIAFKMNADAEIITSSALLHLKVKNTKEILPDYLTLVLNSDIVKLQAERDSNGAIIQHWKPSDIENVIIPIPDMNIQIQITNMLQKSYILRKQSKEFLEYAKMIVEIALEQNEESANLWLAEKGVDC